MRGIGVPPAAAAAPAAATAAAEGCGPAMLVRCVVAASQLRCAGCAAGREQRSGATRFTAGRQAHACSAAAAPGEHAHRGGRLPPACCAAVFTGGVLIAGHRLAVAGPEAGRGFGCRQQPKSPAGARPPARCRAAALLLKPLPLRQRRHSPRTWSHPSSHTSTPTRSQAAPSTPPQQAALSGLRPAR